MAFRIVSSQTALSEGDEVLLIKDRWNDWYTWIAQFYAVAVLKDGQRVDIGSVKIAQVGMTPQHATTNLPNEFSALDESWFSIGQSENYYETLNSLGEKYRDWFLSALRDCAQDLSILDANQAEEVLQASLLRDIDMDRVRNRLHRLAKGDAVLTQFAFKYAFPAEPLSLDTAPELTFRVKPNSLPPTNVHVLIGRNGVGKTRCFDLLSRSFLGLPASNGGPAGELTSLNQSSFSENDKGHGFAGLVTVSFSPFDRYGPLVGTRSDLGVRYNYVGLIRESAEQAKKDIAANPLGGHARLTIKSHEDLANDFVESVKACRSGARRTRWFQALQALEADPLFEDVNVSSVGADSNEHWESSARSIFRRLSSGHSVVLLTITMLVELVEERSLVLIDEPESHLHPPLLSAFVRALSNLLTNRNGVAIVATHSPVVLQEVPRDCAWILNRSGHASRVDRPEDETFGENTSILTREVFGLEVTQTGFHRIIAETVIGRSYDEVLSLFNSQLGGEAKTLARSLSHIASIKPADDENDE